jgi:prepilin-type N-terminal cleavage/methylation domain-containing protein
MRTAAFTLIELLIVVAIISILAMIAIPNYLHAQQRAEIAACQGNMKTLAAALLAYNADWGEFPLADGVAGTTPSPTHTAYGNGPAANGYWSGVPLSLVQGGYVSSEDALYCPSLVKRFPKRKQHLRYAYNKGALDVGGGMGGANNIDRDGGDLWILRCLFLDPDIRDQPDSEIIYPHGHDPNMATREPAMENVLFHTGRVELRNAKGGSR